MPLHVRVAEALGWTQLHYPRVANGVPWSHGTTWEHACGDILIADGEQLRWKGRPPTEALVGPTVRCTLVPRFDEDDAAAASLIDILNRFAIEHLHSSDLVLACRGFEAEVAWVAEFRSLDHDDGWAPVRWRVDGGQEDGVGPTWRVALCELLVALHAAGRKVA